MVSRKLVLCTALLLLNGCGAEDSSSQASNNIMAPLAGDAFEVLSKNDGQTTVSLEDVVIDPQGLSLTLESVVAIEPDCEDPTSINAEELTFTVENEKPELCSYRYSVKNHPAQASAAMTSEANSYVLKSASANSTLPPLSETTQVDLPITISIAAVAGYTLDSEVVVLGDGSAMADSTESTITYTPNAQGVTRLIYTMTSDDDTDMMTGTIDVAVSDIGNTAPSVEPVNLPVQPDDAGYYDINQPYIIDLSDYVSDADGDDVQLIQVQAWNANVALAAPDDPTNLSFTFKTSMQGAHYVTYAVSDHRGGYNVEQVRIEVYDLSSVATWNDIQKGAKLFLAPLTQSEALVSETQFTSSHIDSNGANVATFNFDQAQSSCESKGHLPTSADLTELMNFEDGPVAKGWPSDVAYWANDDGIPTLINLISGETEAESANGNYVTCLNEGGFTIDTETSDFEAVANGEEKAIIVVKLTLNGEPVEGQLVEASTDNTNVTLDAQEGTTDDDGLTSFALSSFVAEDVPVNITYSGETLTQNVTFVADEVTSTLSLIVTKDGASANGLDSNEVEATMVDVNDNPLIGRSVTFESDSDESVTITPEPNGTDAMGKQKASIVWSGDALSENSIVKITARFTPESTGTEISDTTPVTFSATTLGMCGFGVDDNDKNNASGNCLKVASDPETGFWFTGTPSTNVLDAFEYDNYTGFYHESAITGPSGGFATFNRLSNNDQAMAWCQKLNELEFADRNNWRIPSFDELQDFYNSYSSLYGGLWKARGWATYDLYWSSTSSYSFDDIYKGLSLFDGTRDGEMDGWENHYVTCMSEN